MMELPSVGDSKRVLDGSKEIHAEVAKTNPEASFASTTKVCNENGHVCIQEVEAYRMPNRSM